ncbi:thioesterase II family protein [Rouxiella sp. Mn2063]|uniref:thioesterase II family protein n=1 Tax=Rouxiella sp. Mn2063 TaxID=3395262 RepID=UPI003BC5709D
MHVITDNWFTSLTHHPHAPRRLFIFPFAGGGPASFRQWAGLFPATDILVACLPGRENRSAEPIVTSMDELIAALLPAIAPLLDREFYFLGYSMGGTVAFELTQALKQHGLPQPKHFFVGACQPPDTPPISQRLHLLSDEQLLRELDELGGLPQSAPEEIKQMILPALRADLSLLARYPSPIRPPLYVPISAFCATADALVTRKNMQRWRDKTVMHFKLHDIEGGHFFLHTQRHLLAEIMTAEMPQAYIEPELLAPELAAPLSMRIAK